MYSVKELFLTLQGEGVQSGRRAVFCRFAGCNLWSGRSQEQIQSPCPFCDTDFVGVDGLGGGKFTSAQRLAQAIEACWLEPPPAVWAEALATNGGASSGPDSRLLPGGLELDQELFSEQRRVVFTGGEPLLQLDVALIGALKCRGFWIAVETNGTQLAPAGIDWVCVSPKAGAAWRLRRGQELKLLYPQPGLRPEQACAGSDLEFAHWLLQPIDGPRYAENLRAAIGYCLQDGRWRLSLQTHKLVGLD